MRIGFLISDGRDLTAEEEEAWSYLTSVKRITSKRIRLKQLLSIKELRTSYDVLWWHSDLSPDASLPEGVYARLNEYVTRGGSLLLTLLPAAGVCTMGFEDIAPEVIERQPWPEESWAKDYPDIRGFAPYQGHPIFAGMTGGVYSWMPTKGRVYSAAVYHDSLPSQGKVVAVERQYIKIIPSRRIVIEYAPGKGRVLCAGSYLSFEETQPRVRNHLELFVSNCFGYLTASGRKRAERTTYWTFDAAPPRQVDRHSNPITIRRPEAPIPSAGPSMRRTLEAGQSGEAFDVGGRRCVILGHERQGIREVWCHPVRGLRNISLRLLDVDGGLTLADVLPVSIEARPESFLRTFSLKELVLTERTFAHPSLPAGCVSYDVSNGSRLRLCVTAEIDLRMMWPLDEQATGPLTYAWDEGLGAVVVSTASGELSSVLGLSIRPTAMFVGHPASLSVTRDGQFLAEGTDTRSVRVGFVLDLTEQQSGVTLGFAGSGSSEREAVVSYRTLMEDPLRSLGEQTEAMAKLQGERTMLRVSDEGFNDAYRWALTGTDRFFLTTPGLGSSYVAGFGTVERGWDGGQAVSGRPGYAWYFGRDAVWTAFAALAVGDFEKVRGVLEFLGRHQDVTGKILHELTTSGFAHFDAADSTPLYLMLMGRYVRASGHRSFARGEFVRIRKALDFCFSTDTDGDGLIENTNVGHGWVEGGGLFPVHTEHYLAACWASALDEASFLASTVGHPQLAKRWKSESERVREKTIQNFWDEEKGYIRFGVYKDGTYNRERTLLPAVGLYLGIGTADQAEKTLRPFASSDFTTDWGVRIIGASNPMFKPTGYHYGSVWPLFTGWAALAEFRHNRPLQGYLHAMSTAMTYRYQSAGYVEEVLRGDVFEPAGVCPHQAWSESMVLQPLTDGMLGIEANGFDNTLKLTPWLPPQWSEFKATKIRVGQSQVSFSVERGEHSTSVTFTLEGRHAVDLSFALRFPLGTLIERATIDGNPVPLSGEIRHYTESPGATFRLQKTATLVYEHRGGIGVVPPLPAPEPGAASRGIRVIDESLEGSEYVLTLEAPASSAHACELIHRGSRITSHAGCEIRETYVGRSSVRISFDGSGGYVRRTVRFRTL